MDGAAPLSQAFARRPRTLSKLRASRVVHVCGAPGTGKSTISAALAAILGLPAFGIDDERIKLLRPGQSWPTDDVKSWMNLEDRINEAGHCIVETSGLHGNDVLLLTGRQVFRVLCIASEAVRRQRLEQRVRDGYALIGGQPDYVRKLLRIAAPRVRADALIDTGRGQPLSQIVEALAVPVIGTFLSAE